VKPRDLILIVLTGASLVILAPTAERAGQAGKMEPAQDVKIMPAQEEKPAPVSQQAKLQPATFSGDTEKLKTVDN